jgi:propionyl-CoA carboxylase beta chain
VPRDGHLPYDVRAVLRDVVDDGDLLELHAHFAPSVVVGLARLDGWPVGLVANQPDVLAGALDIASSQKAARFVRFCDAFNLPIITFVDTPGFRPGRDQEWRGMIRHGAQLAFAYAEATVPRCCVILRKAYGGAYIVMDAKSMGNDHCVAWPSAEVAVMGAAGAVEILHRRALDTLDPESRDAAHDRLLADYEATYLTPRLALARGAIDEVIQPGATRAVLAGALAALPAKRERVPHRRHANTPL